MSLLWLPFHRVISNFILFVFDFSWRLLALALRLVHIHWARLPFPLSPPVIYASSHCILSEQFPVYSIEF